MITIHARTRYSGEDTKSSSACGEETRARENYNHNNENKMSARQRQE